MAGSGSVWAEEVTVLSEDFTTNNTVSLLTTAGWTLSGNCSMSTLNTKALQIASGKGNGTAQTPSFSSLSGTSATLTFYHKSSGSASRTLTITGNGCKVDGKTSTTVDVASSVSSSTITITEASTTSSITFSAAQNQGTIIDDVVVTYEKASDSPLASIALSGTYPTTFTVGDDFSHTGMTVTATYENGNTADVTSKASFSGYDMSTAGTETVTVSYTENGVTKTNSYDITVKKGSAPKKYKKVTLQSEISEDYNYLIVYENHVFAGVNSSIGTYIDATVTDDMITNPTNAHVVQLEVAETEGNYYIMDGDDYIQGPNGNSLKTTTDKTADGAEWTITPSSIANVSYSDRALRYNTSSPRFCNYKSSNTAKDAVLYRQVDNITISSAEYATYCGENTLDFNGTDIKVYTATDGETKVTLNEITSGKVPANTPVILYKAGADGTAINVPVIASAETPEGTNDLHVVGTGGLTGEDNIYVLAKNPTVGFYLWDSSATLNEGKIYLQGKATYGARQFLGFSEETAIEGVKAQAASEGRCYNLNGQQVAQPTKGLYIIGGKKVMMK